MIRGLSISAKLRAQMHMKPLIIATVVASSFVTAALADITIQTAKIAKGELIIDGIVSPHTSKVVLTISPGTSVEVAPDRQGRFTWKGAKFPATCSVEVHAGNVKKTVLVANCGMQGPPGPSSQSAITSVI